MTNHFDSVAKDWDNNSIHIQRTEAIAAEMLKSISFNKSMKALEFGAGTGLLSFALKDYFKEITLMDNSIEMSKVASAKVIEANISNIKTLVFDLEKEDYTSEKFDIIYSQMALHHVVDVESVISKFDKMLNPNGILVIADLCKEDGSFHDYNAEVHLGFEPELLQNTLKSFSFENINHNVCYSIKRTDQNGVERDYPIFLMVAEKRN
ncbi:MAG: class I SAM-dependent methyltransferase [Bacteroidota bacterium]